MTDSQDHTGSRKSGSDPWEAVRAAARLRKAGQVGAALATLREAYRGDPDFGPVRTMAAWCLYDRDIKDATSATESLAATLTTIAQLCTGDGMDPYDRFSPHPVALLRGARLLLDAGRRDAALGWLDLLGPDRLDATPTQVTDQAGRSRTLPSPWERHALARSDALANLRRWDDYLAALPARSRHPASSAPRWRDLAAIPGGARL